MMDPIRSDGYRLRLPSVAAGWLARLRGKIGRPVGPEPFD